MTSSGSPAPLRKRGKSIAQFRLSRRLVNRVQVYFNAENVTPRTIPVAVFKAAKERNINVSDMQIAGGGGGGGIAAGTLNQAMGQASKLFMNSSFTQARTASAFLTGGAVSSLQASFTDVVGATSTSAGAGAAAGSSMPLQEDIYNQESVSTIYEAPIPPMPEFISLVIHETDTIILLDLPSSTVEKDTPEGALVEEDNATYEYLTEGRGKNRKMVNAIIQTVSVLNKTKFTEAPKLKCTNDYSFVSLWELYDTYYDDYVEKNESKLSLTSLEKDTALTNEDIAMIKLSRNQRYMDSVCIMQRILANNVFNAQQKRFRGLSDPSPFREGIEYNYRLNFLWSFANEDTKDRCVSAMCVNKVNQDVIAVGYGRFYYDEDVTGLVLLWNIKNPVQPEREYHFKTAVTSLDFSNQYHNTLAIGFYDGTVNVLDVSKREISLIGVNCKETSELYEPIWQLNWYTDVDYYRGQEFLVATCQNGRIVKLRLNRQSVIMRSSHMMRITSAEGKLKGIATLRKCLSKKVSHSRHSPALVYTPHPVDPRIYYISTSEGIVHKCSKNYFHQHLDLFLAHDGPMYSMEFSPFCNKLFLTCGDDWAIRLWADGIAEPLFEIKKRWLGVQGVAWSPSHSTIIASISGNEIFIWDLQRKTYDSQSATLSPTKSRNTLIKFTHDGRCLLVADIDGNVHVFSLEDMPFAAYFQENLLTQSIKRALITRPDLLNSIDKLDGLSFPPEASVML